MNNKSYIVTILDSVTETSMPFHEFVLYRAKHYSEEVHIVVVIGIDRGLPDVQIPCNVSVCYLKRNLFVVRKYIKGLLDRLSKMNAPYAFHLHHPKSGFIAFISMAGTSFRKKTLFTVHNTFSGYSFHNKCLSFINAMLSRYVTCVSIAAYNSYPIIIRKIKKERIEGIQNGTDFERIDLIQSEIEGKFDDSVKNKVKFVYVARMVEVKNHDYFVDIIKKSNPNAYFIFIGAEDSKGWIRSKVNSLGLQYRIKMTGLISRNDVFRYLKDADVYISPSRLEGLPVSVLEAMYTGLPVLLSDIEPHKEIAVHSDAVKIIREKDIKEWLDAIDKFTRMSGEDRKAIGEKCRQCAKNTFSLLSMHKKYTSIYVKIFDL